MPAYRQEIAVGKAARRSRSILRSSTANDVLTAKGNDRVGHVTAIGATPGTDKSRSHHAHCIRGIILRAISVVAVPSYVGIGPCAFLSQQKCR